jgi:K+ transporter
VPVALGRHLLFREISKGGWLAIALVVAIVALMIYWPRIAGWVERRWFGD